MSRICLDTSAYSHFKRGNTVAAAILDSADWVGVPVIVLGELGVGFRIGGQRERNERELKAFLDHPVAEIVEVDAATAEIFSDIVVELRMKGRPLPTNDIWIAATAGRHGAQILTFDRHFEQIQRVGTIVLEP